jgi:predicted TIM-barrel fold metal-dependent hydrolase
MRTITLEEHFASPAFMDGPGRPIREQAQSGLMIQRMDHTMTPERTKLKRPIGAYLRENVHYTFSGFNYTSIFLNLLLEVGVDRIMFSADYPYASMREARDFLDRLPVSDADREKIAHGNAERPMRI